MVALHAAIHDCPVALLLDPFASIFGIHPLGVLPHARVYDTKFNRCIGICADGVFEGRVEVQVVEKDVWVVVPAIEMAFNGFDRFNDPIQFLIPGEYDKRGVGAGLRSVRLLPTKMKNLVMLFADFPGTSVSAQVL